LNVVATAYQAIGTPYLWGGNDGNGFDCSGLIRYAYRQYGIDLPRISRDQLKMGEAVPLEVLSLRPGDVLGFSAVPGGPAAHVGLYVGDGEFIHSSTRGVRVSDLREPYWQRHFMAARRMVREYCPAGVQPSLEVFLQTTDG
jgi:cell wall-associated NlpC family hydrolase